MNDLYTNQIINCEERLRQAMLRSDVDALDELLSSELVFTNHLGQIMSKDDDLNAHKSGLLKLNEIILSDNKISHYGDVVVVTVKAHIIGSYDGAESDSDFRFTRVWNKESNKLWKIVAGHSSAEI